MVIPVLFDIFVGINYFMEFASELLLFFDVSILFHTFIQIKNFQNVNVTLLYVLERSGRACYSQHTQCFIVLLLTHSALGSSLLIQSLFLLESFLFLCLFYSSINGVVSLCRELLTCETPRDASNHCSDYRSYPRHHGSAYGEACCSPT